MTRASRVARVLWALGPWLGLGLFIWRQQGLEARLAEWVAASNRAIQEHTRATAETEDGPLIPMTPR